MNNSLLFTSQRENKWNAEASRGNQRVRKWMCLCRGPTHWSSSLYTHCRRCSLVLIVRCRPAARYLAARGCGTATFSRSRSPAHRDSLLSRKSPFVANTEVADGEYARTFLILPFEDYDARMYIRFTYTVIHARYYYVLEGDSGVVATKTRLEICPRVNHAVDVQFVSRSVGHVS